MVQIQRPEKNKKKKPLLFKPSQGCPFQCALVEYATTREVCREERDKQTGAVAWGQVTVGGCVCGGERFR